MALSGLDPTFNMSNRLKRKLDDLGVNISSSKVNESFCLVSRTESFLEIKPTHFACHRLAHPYHHSRNPRTLESLCRYGNRMHVSAKFECLKYLDD